MSSKRQANVGKYVKIFQDMSGVRLENDIMSHNELLTGAFVKNWMPPRNEATARMLQCAMLRSTDLPSCRGDRFSPQDPQRPSGEELNSQDG